MNNCPVCNQLNHPTAGFCSQCGAPLLLQNKYRITRLLGRGGFGSVYLAEHLSLTGVQYAIKEMLPDPGATLAKQKQAEEQFRLEANLLARLNHPMLPKVWDYFSENSRYYLVMEYVEGETLQERLGRVGTSLVERDVVKWANDLCQVLEYLHSRQPQVIHRDIKPSNIKIAPNGTLKLIDFGIAKFMAVGISTATAARAVSAPYSPMEQYGSGTDARSDIYALGVTLYQLLTNHLPPEAPDRMTKPVVPPHQWNPTLSAGLEAVILKTMDQDPLRRFQNATEMQTALRKPKTITTTVPVPSASPNISATVPARHTKIPYAVISLALVSICALVIAGIALIGSAAPTMTAMATRTPIPMSATTGNTSPALPSSTLIAQLTMVAPSAASSPNVVLTQAPMATAMPASSPTTRPVAPAAIATTKPNVPTIAPCPTSVFYQGVWKSRTQLGCSKRAERSDLGYQNFQRGLMLWRKNTLMIYAVYKNGRWESQPDPGPYPSPACADAAKNGDLGPIFGFGKLWCAGWKDQIGQPLEREQAITDSAVEDFVNGLVLDLGKLGKFILYSSGTWESF